MLHNLLARRHRRATHITTSYLCGLAALFIATQASLATADSVEAVYLAPGYTAKSLELGVPFGGAIAHHPTNQNLLYVSAGEYGQHTILEVQTDTGTTRTITPVVGNIGGLAVLNNGDIAITENMTSETILRARDLDNDGAFLSAGEISELIAPINIDGSFSGAQVAVAPADNAAAIPAGSLLVQTADGSNLSEILVIQNPESSPSYLPAGNSWYSGFTYNGGIAFSPTGHVLCGISEFPVGRVAALVNANANSQIDEGEVNTIIGSDQLENSISDLTATTDGKLITAENSGTIRWFDLPDDLLTETAQTSGVLAETNATYVSSARADFPARSFTPGGAAPVATVYLGGFVSYPAATNLLAISPVPAAACAAHWELFY